VIAEPAAALRYRIGVASRADAAEVEAVRRSAYDAAREFTWNDAATLAWNAADDAGCVLVLHDAAGTLLSTLRINVLAGIAEAEQFLEYALAGIDARPPLLVLSRAASRPEHARRGLFALLRQAYLDALPATPVASVVALVYEGGPRLQAMVDAGYVLHEPRAGWDEEAVAHTRPLLAVLQRASFAAAAAQVRRALGAQLDGVAADAAAIAAAITAAASGAP
jgi:hypothetical protein